MPRRGRRVSLVFESQSCKVCDSLSFYLLLDPLAYAEQLTQVCRPLSFKHRD